MKTKIFLSTLGTGLTSFIQGQGEVFRKDFIRAGDWVVRQKGKFVKFSVTPERIKKWEETFKLFRQRGISVPLTVDHKEVADTSGKKVVRKLKPTQAEAKRGDVVNLFAEGSVGYFDVVPADKDSETLMTRCPEVSLELETDLVDGLGNHYDEAITAITLTPIPVMPGQQMTWDKVPAREVWEEMASAPVKTSRGEEVVYLSADPMLNDTQNTQENSMSPSLLQRLRNATKMSTDPEDEVCAKAVHHMEMCRSGEYMSREDHDKLTKEAVDKALEDANKLQNENDAKITKLSRDLEQAKAGTRVITIDELARDVDEDALDMAASGITARIEALAVARKCTPGQKKLLLSRLVGETGKRPVIALSRKTASKVGLPDPLANIVLEIFESADLGEMTKLLKETTGTQQKTVLNRENDATHPQETDAQYDPEVTKRMIASFNNKEFATSGFSM